MSLQKSNKNLQELFSLRVVEQWQPGHLPLVHRRRLWTDPAKTGLILVSQPQVLAACFWLEFSAEVCLGMAVERLLQAGKITYFWYNVIHSKYPKTQKLLFKMAYIFSIVNYVKKNKKVTNTKAFKQFQVWIGKCYFTERKIGGSLYFDECRKGR